MTKRSLSLVATGLTAAIIMTGTIAAFGGTTQKVKNIEAGHDHYFSNPLGVNRDRKEDRLVIPNGARPTSMIV